MVLPLSTERSDESLMAAYLRAQLAEWTAAPRVWLAIQHHDDGRPLRVPLVSGRGAAKREALLKEFPTEAHSHRSRYLHLDLGTGVFFLKMFR